MTLQWYRQDREAVLAALARGEQPDMATTLSAGVVDELVALHEDLGVLPALGETPTVREWQGVPDALLLRTLATLPFVAGASLSGATETLFKEPALLTRLGWAPAHLRAGTNARHPEGRQPESLPCHPDTLRDALRRVAAQTWETVQRTGVQALYGHGLVGGHVDAVDGSGIGPQLRVVALVCVSAQRPLIVAWRLLEGAASEKGKAAAVTRGLVEQALALGGAAVGQDRGAGSHARAGRARRAGPPKPAWQSSPPRRERRGQRPERADAHGAGGGCPAAPTAPRRGSGRPGRC